MQKEREYGPSDAADSLLSATRRLMLAATTSGHEDAALREIAGRLDELSARLEERGNQRMRRVPFDAARRAEVLAGAPWRMLPYSALGIPQSITVSGGRARSRVHLTALHEGPPGILHGGHAAALLDSLLGVLVMTEVSPAVTAELSLTFHRPTPLDQAIEIEARVLEVRARTVFTEGSIVAGGVTTVTARGVFVPVVAASAPR